MKQFSVGVARGGPPPGLCIRRGKCALFKPV